MKVRLEAYLFARDGERSMVRVVDMPAPPVIGLQIVGDDWEIEVSRVFFAPTSGDYRASCKGARDEERSIADVIRALESDGWRAAAT